MSEKKDETVQYIINECSNLVQKDYKNKHGRTGERNSQENVQATIFLPRRPMM